MGAARKIAEIPAGSWTKWLVVAFWAIVVVIAFPLAGKLSGAEKNDAKAWLPAKAESTKVVDVQARFQSPNILLGVVVYERPSGVTAADRAKAASDAEQFAGVHGVAPGETVGPILAVDGKAIQTIVSVNLGKEGWNNAPKTADAIRAITAANANGLTAHLAGPLGNAADSGEVFKGIDTMFLAFSTAFICIGLFLLFGRSPLA